MPNEAQTPSPLFSNSEWCAYAPEKEAWKRHGNFFTAEELRKMDEADEVMVYQPMKRTLSGD